MVDGINVVGGLVMATLGAISYIVLHLIAKSLEKKARKEWLERNSSGPFDLGR